MSKRAPQWFGLGLALALCAPLHAQPGDDPASRHTLNLDGADIGVLIQTVSEITGRSFIVDPAVEGRITLVSSHPQGPEEIWQTFESVLRLHGFAVVASGNMWKVLPEAAAVRDAGTPVVGPGPQRPDALVTRVIDVTQVAAAELVTLLRPLVPASAQLAAQGGRLVITDRAANVERIARLVQRIDTASEDEVEVIALRHANASEMARTLAQLEAGQPQGLDAAGRGRLIADARTNSVLISGARGGRLRLRTLVAHLDTPLSEGEATQVVYLRYADGAPLVPVLEAIAATLTGDAGTDAAATATIQHHVETNALVVTAAPAVYRELAAVVRSLDVRRAQVLVEAVIAEVSDELADELGVQWQATDVREDGQGGLTRGVIGGSNLPGSGQGIIGVNPFAVGPGLHLGYLDRVLNLPVGPDGAMQPVFQLGVLVRALRGDGRANVLSQPSVVTLDHHEAEFKVAQEVPFLTGQYATTGTGVAQPQNPFQTIERRDVGLILRVTPHVNEGDSVRLDIFQEISSLAPTQVSGAVDLVTNKREIRTSVLVPDGGLLVLGGLSSEDISEQIQGVPGLSRIPGVGALFRNRQTARQKRNLMIFMRPTILRDGISEAAVSSEKYNFLRSEQLQMRERFEGGVRGGPLPLLPAEPQDLFRTPPPPVVAPDWPSTVPPPAAPPAEPPGG